MRAHGSIGPRASVGGAPKGNQNAARPVRPAEPLPGPVRVASRNQARVLELLMECQQQSMVADRLGITREAVHSTLSKIKTRNSVDSLDVLVATMKAHGTELHTVHVHNKPTPEVMAELHLQLAAKTTTRMAIALNYGVSLCTVSRWLPGKFAKPGPKPRPKEVLLGEQRATTREQRRAREAAKRAQLRAELEAIR